MLDYNMYDENIGATSDSDDASGDSGTSNKEFIIQIFGIDEHRNTYSVKVEGFRPFFYVKVTDDWKTPQLNEFANHLGKKIGGIANLTQNKLVKRKTLYGFDGGKEHKFVFLEFMNMAAYNRAKNLWYTNYKQGHTLLKHGYPFGKTQTQLYEANIPPLLRFFHIRNLSPSGWVCILKSSTRVLQGQKQTYNFTVKNTDIVPLNDKATRVPYKIMSFDIEASSSHGDFPLPKKTYKKLADQIVDSFIKHDIELDESHTYLHNCLYTAFGYRDEVHIDTRIDIDLVYPKKSPTRNEVTEKLDILIKQRCSEDSSNLMELQTIERYFYENAILDKAEKANACVEGDETESETDSEDDSNIHVTSNYHTILHLLCSTSIARATKIETLNKLLTSYFPSLEGDKVTFIGSTFLKYGCKEPYLNHCIAMNTCAPVANAVIESYATEKEVLLAWQQLVQRENPDIIIGYNMFGFDYEFMFRRAEENDCVEEFLKLSRNADEICGKLVDGQWRIEEKTLQIASGQHDLRLIKMPGRIQIDLYNYYRREVKLDSYKLDSTAGHFLGDYVKSIQHDSDKTVIQSSNLAGLYPGSYVHFEEIGNSTQYYDNGAKFFVTEVNLATSQFCIRERIAATPSTDVKLRWCLAKDDLSPKDIFRLTRGSNVDRALVAKYCIQDCNLVHYLFQKSDILTGYIEMATICSVPIEFLVMRGQGIKLTSFISKKCREKRTLMPVIEKCTNEDGYEGAIVLDPKCGLYLDNPVACNDYASLYPSSMISENLSSDSKVWTREYDLQGTLVKEWGEKNAQGEFIYDNLPGYSYVDITYDVYTYKRIHPKAAAKKILRGYKTCRFVQPQTPDTAAIMPSILKELLKARKDTRKLIPGEKDEFMKSVLEQRQLGYKLTANSLYGQCGAKTSTFYDLDIAECTTATGRKMLTYGKRIVEECYKNRICDTTNHGKVRTRSEYIYGDTDSVFYTFNLEDPETGAPIRGKKALEITIELAQQVGDLAASFMKAPHDFEYEKTFMPYCLLSKKRYVGMLYEKDVNKCKRKEMGCVLNRRDNAPIVKDIYGGIINVLMKEQDLVASMNFLKLHLQNMIDEKCAMEKLIVTKSLRSHYKNPQSIAHKVLADRIAERDPGNKPSPGDRIPYVYIVKEGKKVLQGERIETPSFIIEKSLKIDYSHYITNQIMKPVQQLFALVLEKIYTINKKIPKLGVMKKKIDEIKKTYIDDPVKMEKKIAEYRAKEIKVLLFDEFLIVANNKNNRLKSVKDYFK